MSTSSRRPSGRTPERAAIRRGDSPADVLGADLEIEMRVVASRVRDVFTPHLPIPPDGELAGRHQETRKLLSVLNTPGRHAAIIGDQGSGRSSLANVVARMFAQGATRTGYTKRCDHTDTFASILDEPLLVAGVDALRAEFVQQDSRTRKGEFTPFSSVVMGSRERQTMSTTTYRFEGDIGASVAADHLAGQRAFLVVDNLNLLRDTTALYKLGELSKHLSDRAAMFKLLLVGDHATANHMSAVPQLTNLPVYVAALHPMSEDHLRDIVTRGEARLDLSFSEEAKAAIAWISAGYPQFTHLLALKCAENAIRTGGKHIGTTELLDAVAAAVKDADNALRESYRTGTAPHPGTCGELLRVAASLDDNEFDRNQLRACVNGRFDLNGPLRHLVSDDRSAVLHRISRGVYQFSDPRMRCYVRLVHRVLGPPE